LRHHSGIRGTATTGRLFVVIGLVADADLIAARGSILPIRQNHLDPADWSVLCHPDLSAPSGGNEMFMSNTNFLPGARNGFFNFVLDHTAEKLDGVVEMIDRGSPSRSYPVTAPNCISAATSLRAGVCNAAASFRRAHRIARVLPPKANQFDGVMKTPCAIRPEMPPIMS
jgi:hypothetical protein